MHLSISCSLLSHLNKIQKSSNSSKFRATAHSEPIVTIPPFFPLRTAASDLEAPTFIPVSSTSGITFHSESRRSPPDEARRTILPIKDRDKILKAPHTASHAPINCVYKNDDQIQWKVTAQAQSSTHWEWVWCTVLFQTKLSPPLYRGSNNGPNTPYDIL